MERAASQHPIRRGGAFMGGGRADHFVPSCHRQRHPQYLPYHHLASGNVEKFILLAFMGVRILVDLSGS